MRILIASIVIGPLMLLGVLPAVAQSPPATGSGTQVQSAAGAGSTVDRKTYTQKARDDMQEWGRKLHDFGENARPRGKRYATRPGMI